MGDDLARRTHTVFVAALDVDQPGREDYVRSACAGDTRLEARVRRLLAALPRSTQFLETPAIATRVDDSPDPDPQAIRVRGYQLLRAIGFGGMATVYEAQQDEPRRTVALKIMSRALASTSAVRRFKYETETLARLQHPGIAQIYEAGTCDDGSGRALPFFAMELVADARTITDFADARGLSLRERLALFASACDAVHHGHQQGVIHRDLKPANILVGGDGRAKIIDFGVARPADAAQADLTRHVDRHQLIGTLNAMSPEQCTDAARVDVRSDVYALGVMLYQLVAGRLPHDLSRASVPEAVRIITHEAPPSLGALKPEARGDLSAIASCAMEKDRERRYPGAAALAADIRRYLDHRPIDARPATTLYQIGKFARRNRPLVAAIAAVFLTLVVGIASTTRSALIADRARRAAEARERELERVTSFQESQLSDLDLRGMGERLRTALLESAGRAAASDSTNTCDVDALQRLMKDVNFTTLALRSVDESVLQRSYDAIHEQFADHPILQARLLHRLAGTMNTLGLPERAEQVMSEALRIRRQVLGDDHRDTLLSQHGSGSLLSALGRYDEAIEVLRDARERLTRTLGPDDILTLRAGTSLGGALRHKGDLRGAEEVWAATLAAQRRVLGNDDESTLRALNNMGVIYAVQGKLVDAEACWRELLERRRRLRGDAHADTRRSLGNLGLVLHEQGKLTEARGLLEEELAASRENSGDDHPDTLISMSNLAALLLDLGELDAAESLARECDERRRRTLGPDHPATLLAQATQSALLARTGCFSDAETLLQDTRDTQRRVVGNEHPHTVESLTALAKISVDAGHPDDAATLAREALEIALQIHGPEHWAVGLSLAIQGRAWAAFGRWDDAEASMLEGHRILDAARGPRNLQTREAAQALADLYAARDSAAPGERYAAAAALWRARATEYETAEHAAR